jgi:hypothetical protein
MTTPSSLLMSFGKEFFNSLSPLCEVMYINSILQSTSLFLVIIPFS